MNESDFIHLLHAPAIDKGRALAAEVLSRYFRVEVKGAEYLTETGPIIMVPNHSGFAGLDAIILSHEIHKLVGRSPKILAHRAYFDLVGIIAKISSSFGLTRAHMTDAIKELRHGAMLTVFPEAENGNFKSSFRRYQLQKFHSGAVRLALATGAPIIPTLIVGAEESNLNLGNIDLSGIVKHLVVPIPLNLVPLPAKWCIEFLPPYDLSAVLPGKSKKSRPAQSLKITEDLRSYMQKALDQRLAKRKYVFFDGIF